MRLNLTQDFLSKNLLQNNLNYDIIIFVLTERRSRLMSNKKLVEAITSMNDDFAQWYTDVVTRAGLVSYSSVKGFVILQPLATAIWENIRNGLDAMFKETGHENVIMPLLIPENLLQKEKDHVEGFAPEVAWVTHGGTEQLQERLCIRPTSETLFCEHYANIIYSWRDLPKLYNQWCNVVRWEKSTRPFLRSREFQWQEGHTIHETAKEAKAETLQMLDVYATFAEQVLAIPVIKGQKSELEKFAGAEVTYTIEAMMHDGKALQSGTSHYFGDHFAKAFNINFTSRDNTITHPFQTSWGVSTRLIGGIIMTHGDDSGLKLPPKIAPTQVRIIPIAAHKQGVIEKCEELKSSLKSQIRVDIDTTDNSPGWKFSQSEMLGIPLRLELGPRDIENNQCVLVRRDTGEKIITALENLTETINSLLDNIQQNMFESALKRRESMTYIAKTTEEFAKFSEKPGLIKSAWCGENTCEEMVKEKYQLTTRCMPFGEKTDSDTCAACGKKAITTMYFGKAY